jgi:hypothetical protein
MLFDVVEVDLDQDLGGSGAGAGMQRLDVGPSRLEVEQKR